MYFDSEDDGSYDYCDDNGDQDAERFILQLSNLRFLSLKKTLSVVFLPRIDALSTNVVLVANYPFTLDGDEDPPNMFYVLLPHFSELHFLETSKPLTLLSEAPE